MANFSLNLGLDSPVMVDKLYNHHHIFGTNHAETHQPKQCNMNVVFLLLQSNVQMQKELRNAKGGSEQARETTATM